MQVDRRGLDETLGSSDGTRSHSGLHASELPSGAKVGRYVVLLRLGAGGMGVVYMAHDPELDRNVALKLVRPGGSGKKASVGRSRLLREAQAMARVTHPNVVTIHDTGEHEGCVYLAMELVVGTTLSGWLAAQPRPWREVVHVLAHAGRGLAAAHDKELVHRDFKPDNVMVADDGRVLVMDFGLARARKDVGPQRRSHESPLPPMSDPGLATDSSSADLLSNPLTQHGSVVGTPAYMGPEQHLGLPVDARTDQFSFCVTLYEALYGERPFAGDTPVSLAFSITEGSVRPPVRSRGVPRWLRHLCLRGLSTIATDRWSSLNALLAALERGLQRQRQARRGLWVMGGGAVLALGLGVHRFDVQQRIESCERAGAAIAAVYGEDNRARIHDAIAQSGAPDPDALAAKATPWLQQWTRQWQQTRVATCLAVSVEHTWDEEMGARADACLSERRMRLDALVKELERADRGVAYQAVSAAASLPSVLGCGDMHQLGTWSPWPADGAEETAAILDGLARVSASSHAGQYAAALDLATPLLERATKLDHPPLTAEVRRVLGSLHFRLGHYKQAELLLATAYVQAQSSGAARTGADAATALIVLVGATLSRHGEGLVWAKAAEAAIAPLEPDAGLRTAHYLTNLAGVHDEMGEYETALALLERATDLSTAALGPNHPELASRLADLASLHTKLGRYDRARELQARALAIRSESFGPRHPEIAASLSAVAKIRIREGDHAEAIALLEQARDIATEAYGEAHPSVGLTLGGLGSAHRSMGALDQALPLLERALVITEEALGPDHIDVAGALNNLATAHVMRGDHAQAKAAFERALRIDEAALGAEHPELVRLLVNLARLQELDNEFDAARALYQRGLSIRSRALGPDHPQLAYIHVGMGDLALEEDRPAEAVAHAERALALRGNGAAPPGEVAEAQYLLARAHWDNDAGERHTALALAETAARTFRSTEGMERHLAIVEAWLDERRTVASP